MFTCEWRIVVGGGAMSERCPVLDVKRVKKQMLLVCMSGVVGAVRRRQTSWRHLTLHDVVSRKTVDIAGVHQ